MTQVAKNSIFLPHFRITLGSGTPIVLLHGWGGSIESWQILEKNLIDSGYTVIVVDFAGFGQTPEPPSDWGINEYAQSIRMLLDHLEYKEYNLIGHSFGGRVCILLANYKSVNKILLCNSAGLKPKRSLKYHFKVWKYKLNKKLGKDTTNAGSHDYRALSDNMKQVFVKVVNQHLDAQLSRITTPTLIVWGDKDTETPLYMAKKLNKNIVGSGLIVLKDAGHYSYIQYSQRFFLIVESFFSK